MIAQTEEKNILSSAPIGWLMLKYAIPSVVALVVNALYNIVDQVFIGWGVGTLGNSATNVIFPLNMVMMAFALLIGDGGAACLSLELGRGNQKKAEKGVNNTFTWLIIVAVLFFAVCAVFLKPLTGLFGATPDNLEYALAYGRIIVFGFPFAIVGCGMCSLIRADGTPQLTMIAMIVGCLSNVVLDAVLVLGFGWGMEGAAIGVDGKLAGRVAEHMLQQVEGGELIFTCPNPDRVPEEKKERWKQAGVTLRAASYDDEEQMTAAFSGGERLFFISSILNGERRVRQHRAVIQACKKAGIEHITYTSFFGANREGYHQYVLPDHRATEKMLRECGLAYNIMRNNLYMENYLTTSVMLAMLSNNVWGTTAGEGKVTSIAKDDSARCGAALLLGKGAPNKDYDLTSLEPLSQRDICSMIAEKSGIPFVYKPMNAEEFLAYLEALHIPKTTDGDFSRSPVPFCSNDMITNEAGIAEGQMGVVSHDVELLTGRKPLEVRDLLDEYSYVWKEKVTNWKQMY